MSEAVTNSIATIHAPQRCRAMGSRKPISVTAEAEQKRLSEIPVMPTAGAEATRHKGCGGVANKVKVVVGQLEKGGFIVTL